MNNRSRKLLFALERKTAYVFKHAMKREGENWEKDVLQKSLQSVSSIVY